MMKKKCETKIVHPPKFRIPESRLFSLPEAKTEDEIVKQLKELRSRNMHIIHKHNYGKSND